MSFPAPTEKQAHIIWSGLSILSVALSLAVIGGVFYALASLLSYLSPVLMPIAVAGILACLLDPAVCFFERLHIPRVRSVLLVYLITGGFLVALIGTVIPAAYVQAVGLIGDAQARYAEFRRSHPPSKTRPDETATLPSLENDASISNNVALVPQMSANNEPLPTEPPRGLRCCGTIRAIGSTWRASRTA
jgi:predicted PurR-regulated permease PerM